MKTIRAIALGAAAVALAGAAAAAAPSKTHSMDVALPDGAVAHISYVGNVAPKVRIDPRPLGDDPQDAWGMPFPSFAGFDRMIREMNARTEQMMRQAQQMTVHPGVAAPYIASYSNLPAGQTSTTVVSVSNGGATCTRSTEVVSEGPGKPPKVTSNVTGQCGAAPAAVAPAQPVHPA